MSSCNFVVFLLNRIAELMHIVDKQSSKVPVKQASKKSDVYSLVCFLNTAQSVWCEFRIVKYLVYECNCNLHSCVHVVHVWCVLAGPSGFVPRPWLSTCVVCARRAEWFCPSSMVVNLCGVCSQGRVVLSLVHGRQHTEKDPEIPQSLPQDLLDFLQWLVYCSWSLLFMYSLVQCT